jgi:drug/metabolite transporter (DMT)-like permease
MTGKVFLYTFFAMIAFAGNSLLCRLALTHTAMDVASFTSIRIISGALVLWLVVRIRDGSFSVDGNWLSAFALFAYAAGFSFAYVSLPAGTGALLLFAAVQATMITYGLCTGDRLHIRQLFGLLLAFTGLVYLLLPGYSTPPIGSALLMLGAGIAWGVYSLHGRRAHDALRTTTGNFIRAVSFAALLSLVMLPHLSVDASGLRYALLSGGVASGLGYVIWYKAMRYLKATSAATVQLSVPVIVAVGGVVLLSEPVSFRLFFASAAILGGIVLVTFYQQSVSVNGSDTS